MVSLNSRRGVLFGILGLLMVAGAVPAGAQTEPGSVFTDDDGNIHEQNIEFIHAAGITRGCNPPVNDNYCPQLPVTRAQLASFMTRAFDLAPSTTDHFTDDDASVHEGDINSIADAGFVFGCGTGLYCPDDNVSRAQLASVFVRAFGFPASSTDHFLDDDTSVHEDDINALAEVGVTRGCSVDPANYCPFDPVLRDQFASFMARALRLPVNRAPAADPASVTTDEDTAVSIVLTGTDPDGDILAYTVVSGPANGTLSGVAPNLTYTPAPDFSGVDEFTFSVRDDVFTSPIATVDLTVVAVNDAPTLDPIGDQPVDELVSLEFTASAADIDVGDTLAFSLDPASVTAGMSIDPSSGVFAWTPSEVQGPGVFSVTVTVTDDGAPNLSDFETFDVTVAEVNVAPVLGAIGDQSVDELVSLGFTATATDADIPANDLAFTLDAASVTAGMSIDPLSGVFAWTPSEAQGPGVFSVTVTVTDDGAPNLSDFETFDITVNEINVAPTAAAQAYDSVGNVSIVVPAGSGLLTGATDTDSPPQALSVDSFDATTTGGGVVTAVDSATGAFTYTSAPGYTGTDTFTFTVIDDGPGTLASAPATVTITVADLIWFIDNSAAGANDGTLANPFQTIGAFNASADVAAGDDVYLAETGTDYSAGIALDNNQRLIGGGATGASLDAVLGITLPTHSATLPAIGGTSPLIDAAGAGVTVANGNEVRGLDISTTGGVGLTGTSVGGLVVDDVASITSSGAAGIVLSGGSAVAITIDAVTVTASPSGGINLTTMPGTTNLAGVDITTTGGTGLLATNAGTINITGLANAIDSTNGPAVSLTGGTTIGMSGASFESISASGGSAGIVLNATGTGAFTVTGDGASDAADLTRGRTSVGAGGPIALGSGGTISNTTGHSIQLTNASNVTFRNMVVTSDAAGSRRGISLTGGAGLTVDNTRITGFSDDGIHATGLVGLTVTHSEVETNAKSADSIANDESNLTFIDVSGIALIDNSLIRDVNQDNVRISSCEAAACGGTSLAVTFDNVAIRDTLAGAGGNDGILIRSFNDANVALTVTNSEFTNNRSNGIQHNTNDAATAGSTTVTDSVFYGETVEINIAHQGTTHSFNIANNTIRNQLGTVAHTSNAVNVFLGGLSGPGSVLSGTISGNTVGNAAIADSGSLFGQGIELFASGAGTLTANVSGNTVRGMEFGSAFRAISSSHTGTINVTAKTNTLDVTATSGFPLAGLDLTAGALPSDTGTMCADITGNTSFVGETFWAGAYITTAAGSPTINLVGYGGAANDLTAIEAFLDSAATTVNPPAVGSFTTTLGAGTVSGQVAPCPLP
ncbi:MAG: tandem-95 repeat protein [Actinomycetota bacterium]|nr:tandem-95 repeat protein [Actinomycetota bacterium]